MTNTAVTRIYGLAMAAVLAVVALLSFTQPIPTEKPADQENYYALVPEAKDGPPKTATPVEPGDPLLYMRIPRFGSDWTWVALEGTDLDTLALGPGHFTGTALPGEDGNSAFAAHRATHGDPFIDFDLLQPGDEVILAQNGAEWTYRVRFSPKIIEPSENWVTQQHTRAGRAFGVPRLTLVTCWPKYGSEKRMYVRALLVE